ncbi:Hypothetical protein A7982_11205 [Minicystis rosea]|nr:Hypothetical protein A7982_11205 [Minicystis rosea]
MATFSDPSGDYNPYAPPSASSDSPSTPPEDEDEIVILAERGTRFWGRTLDDLLLGLSVIPSLFVIDSLKEETALRLLVMGTLPLVLLCYQWYLVSTTGQSIAKRWLNMKIVRMDGSPAGFVSGVLLRSWIPFVLNMVPYVGSFAAFIDSVMIFGDQRRCLHDQIAGTKVIQVRRS